MKLTEEEIYLNKHDLYIRLLKHDLKLENPEIVKSLNELSDFCTTPREYKKANKLLDRLENVHRKPVINRHVYSCGW